MKYAYEDLGEDQFENLIVCICKEIFGIGTQGFAKGPDGGRDAKFVGTAQLFPSTASPWSGTTIIQAKHVNAYNKSFSDPDFYGNKKSVLGDELPKIKKLRERGELDNYLLFSNRKLTANAESMLSGIIASECNIPITSISLQGVYGIEGFLKQFATIAESAGIDLIDSPLFVNPDDLAEVIDSFVSHLSVKDVIVSPPTERISLEKKNRINAMSQEYFVELSRRHLKDVGEVKSFLELPENDFIREKFQLAVDDFQSEAIAKRKDYQSFDNVLQALKKSLIGRDELLRRNKRLTELFFFICIGIVILEKRRKTIMLRPTKYSHPDKTVVYLALQLLKHLKKQRIDSYDNVLSYGKETVDGASFLFLSAINLLFLLGVIDYRAKNDSFEYVGS